MSITVVEQEISIGINNAINGLTLTEGQIKCRFFSIGNMCVHHLCNMLFNITYSYSVYALKERNGLSSVPDQNQSRGKNLTTKLVPPRPILQAISVRVEQIWSYACAIAVLARSLVLAPLALTLALAQSGGDQI